jgi:hypothetical protein
LCVRRRTTDHILDRQRSVQNMIGLPPEIAQAAEEKRLRNSNGPTQSKCVVFILCVLVPQPLQVLYARQDNGPAWICGCPQCQPGRRCGLEDLRGDRMGIKAPDLYNWLHCNCRELTIPVDRCRCPRVSPGMGPALGGGGGGDRARAGTPKRSTLIVSYLGRTRILGEAEVS